MDTAIAAITETAAAAASTGTTATTFTDLLKSRSSKTLFLISILPKCYLLWRLPFLSGSLYTCSTKGFSVVFCIPRASTFH